MSYTLTFSFSYIPGETIHAQLLDTTFATSGPAITSGVTEVGDNGHYGYTATIDDDFDGYVKFYISGSTDDVVALFSISQNEHAAGIAGNKYVVESANGANAQSHEQILRILLAAVGGESVDGYDWGVKNPAGTKVRIAGSLDSGGKRTAVTVLDGS